jgi:hypothetical protein
MSKHRQIRCCDPHQTTLEPTCQIIPVTHWPIHTAKSLSSTLSCIFYSINSIAIYTALACSSSYCTNHTIVTSFCTAPHCLLMQVQINPASLRSIATNRYYYHGDRKNNHPDCWLQQPTGQDNPPLSHLQKRSVSAIQSGKSLKTYLFHFIYSYLHSKLIDTKLHDYSCLDTSQNTTILQCSRSQLILIHS